MWGHDRTRRLTRLSHTKAASCSGLDIPLILGILAIMLDWSSCPAVERTPEKVSGAWVFRGTRIPVSALFENLESGACVDDFIAWFPGVTKTQVEAVLEHASQSLAIA